MAERLIVVQVVEGSSPFIHPPLQQTSDENEKLYVISCASREG